MVKDKFDLLGIIEQEMPLILAKANDHNMRWAATLVYNHFRDADIHEGIKNMILSSWVSKLVDRLEAEFYA